MLNEPAGKGNPSVLRSGSLPKIANAIADWKDNRFHAEFEISDLRDEAGIVGLQAHLGEGKVSRLEYLMERPDYSWLQSVQHLQEEIGSTQWAAKSDGLKSARGAWPDLEKGAYDFLMCQAYLQCAEALSERGRRLRGTDKEEDMLWQRTNQSLRELFDSLNHKIRTGRNGVEFVRHLLSCEDEDKISLGLSLVTDHFVGSLQDDLQSLCRRRALPDILFRQSFALLAPDRRTAVASWRRAGTTAGSCPPNRPYDRTIS